MPRERIYIAVRTYPDLSTKHIETVCTGGINDAGEWRRLFPVPLRYLDSDKQYQTGNVIKVDVRPGEDGRVESRRPDVGSLVIEPPLKSSAAKWDWIRSGGAFSSIESMTAAGRSIGAIEPAEVLDFIAEPVSTEWTPAETQKLKQELMWDNRKELEKLPWKFRLRWRDGENQERVHTFRSWEVCQTWRAWQMRYGDDAIRRMRDKWLGEVFERSRRPLLFVGNLASRRNIHQIVGSFTPPQGSNDVSLFS